MKAAPAPRIGWLPALLAPSSRGLLPLCRRWRSNAKAEFDRLLPHGRETEGHEILSMIDDAGRDVGYLWFTIEDRPPGRVVFIYDIAVEPEFRRRGHAQAALAYTEAYARDICDPWSGS